jgi:hypothetical protein
MTDKDFKLEFAPGCFDDFEGTQEELDQLVKDIQDMFADGSLFEDSEVLTEDSYNDLPPELVESIFRDIEMSEDINDCVEERKRKLN